MAISSKDKEFMMRVTAYFRSTKSSLDPNGSIRDTAVKFNINRNKVRKILVTMGEIESPISESVLLMRQQGMSIKDIAKDLGVSVATVSTALPYEDKIDNTLDPTEHTSAVREYRAYEKEQLKRQASRTFTKQDMPVVLKGDFYERNNCLCVFVCLYHFGICCVYTTNSKDIKNPARR